MRRIVIFTPLDEKLQDQLKDNLEVFDWLDDYEVHYVHIFKKDNYPYMIPPYIYPNKEQEPEIEKSVIEILEGFSYKTKTKCNFHRCVFHENIRTAANEIIAEIKPHMVATVTRKKEGLQNVFGSSFSEHLLRTSPAAVLVLH